MNERAHAHAKRARTRTNVHKDMPRIAWGNVALHGNTYNNKKIDSKIANKNAHRIWWLVRSTVRLYPAIWIIYKRNAIIANTHTTAYIVHLYNAK